MAFGKKPYKVRGRRNSIQKIQPGVSIITCTHVPYYMDNIFENYARQIHPVKELILILNNNDLNREEWEKKAQSYPNVRIFQIDQATPVGTCMNFAVGQAQYDYIANFDHDDYYGQKYLIGYLEAVQRIDAGLFGKRTHYVFFEENSTLALIHTNKENRYVDFVEGRTMFFKKSIFEKVKFIDSDISDCQFSFECTNNGIRIYSINRHHYTYIRKPSVNLHTWQIDNNELLERFCKIIGKVTDYKPFVNL